MFSKDKLRTDTILLQPGLVYRDNEIIDSAEAIACTGLGKGRQAAWGISPSEGD